MKWLIVLLLAIPAFSQTGTEVSVFGEGLFVQPRTGGAGARIGFDAGPLSLEGEGTYYFHSAPTASPREYNKGFSLLVGPVIPIWKQAHLYATGKGGLIRQKSYSEDVTGITNAGLATVQPGQLLRTTTYGIGFIGLGTEIGSSAGIRIDAGDLLSSSGRLNNFRFTAGVFFRF